MAKEHSDDLRWSVISLRLFTDVEPSRLAMPVFSVQRYLRRYINTGGITAPRSSRTLDQVGFPHEETITHACEILQKYAWLSQDSSMTTIKSINTVNAHVPH